MTKKVVWWMIDDAKKAAPEQPAERVSEGPADRGRDPEAADDADQTREAVLEADERVLLEIGNVVILAVRRALVEDPDDVRPPAAALDVVGVPVAVHVAVMDAMVRAPGQDRVLQRHRAEEEIEGLDRRVALVAAMREEAVVSGRDRDPDRGVENEEQRGLPPLHAERHRIGGGSEDADDRGENEEGDSDPVFFASVDQARPTPRPRTPRARTSMASSVTSTEISALWLFCRVSIRP